MRCRLLVIASLVGFLAINSSIAQETIEQKKAKLVDATVKKFALEDMAFVSGLRTEQEGIASLNALKKAKAGEINSVSIDDLKIALATPAVQELIASKTKDADASRKQLIAGYERIIQRVVNDRKMMAAVEAANGTHDPSVARKLIEQLNNDLAARKISETDYVGHRTIGFMRKNLETFSKFNPVDRIIEYADDLHADEMVNLHDNPTPEKIKTIKLEFASAPFPVWAISVARRLKTSRWTTFTDDQKRLLSIDTGLYPLPR